MISATDPFAAWQLADEVANAAERRLFDAVRACAAGAGQPPSSTQVEVARRLRETARMRLREASRASREGPDGEV